MFCLDWFGASLLCFLGLSFVDCDPQSAFVAGLWLPTLLIFAWIGFLHHLGDIGTRLTVVVVAPTVIAFVVLLDKSLAL